MITDDEVMRILEQANPASVDDPIPMLDIARYRDVLDARNTTMTLTDNEATPSESSSGRRWPILIAAAAAVVAIAVVATREDDATPADQPSPTVTAPPTVPPAAWSPELTARPLEAPVGCDPSPEPYCPHLVASPDGTLVAMDTSGTTLTWYEDEPRVVSLANQLGGNILWAIGPYDIAYIGTPSSFVAVAPSGEEITRMRWPSNASVYPTATGLVPGGSFESSSSKNDLLMRWVDLDGNTITDTTTYPTWTATDGGIEVRLGEQEWLLTELAGTTYKQPLYFLDLRPRSDGGVILVLDTVPGEANLFELLPDGTIERYFVENTWPLTVLSDGSLIVEHNLELIRLTPPA